MMIQSEKLSIQKRPSNFFLQVEKLRIWKKMRNSKCRDLNNPSKIKYRKYQIMLIELSYRKLIKKFTDWWITCNKLQMAIFYLCI